MTRLAELAALAARVDPVRVYATQDPSVSTEVARVLQDSDADVLAAGYNGLPDFVAALSLLVALDARFKAGKLTPLVAQRKAAAALVARYV